MHLSKRLLLAALAAAAPAAAFAAPYDVIYRFTRPPNGVRPQGPLLSDSQGNLFGTTFTGSVKGYGAVYELSPNAGGGKHWREEVIFHFNRTAQGEAPESALISDGKGNLFGMTPAGGMESSGVAYELTPPASGTGLWTETVLHNFGSGKDGAEPYGGLVLGPDGSLYGTTAYGGRKSSGTVFRLAPNSQAPTGWTESIIYTFDNGADGGYPYSTLAVDASGTLYGVTLNGGNTGNGTVFSLTPPASGTKWKESVLHSFDTPDDGAMPREGVTIDPAGNLFGTTEIGGVNGWGVAYEVSPPAKHNGAWTEQVIYTFDADNGGGGPTYTTLLRDASGTLYGTSSHPGEGTVNGTVFSLVPPTDGGTAWTHNELHVFNGGRDGLTPEAGLIFSNDGKLTGTTFFGGGDAQQGVVFQLTP